MNWRKAAVFYPWDQSSKIAASREKSEVPLMDTFPHGMPFGGIGAGTLSRTPDGNFSVWHLQAGRHNYENLSACAFHFFEKNNEKTLSCTLSKRTNTALEAWNFAQLNSHHGGVRYLYPLSEREYHLPESRLKVACEEFSPVIPHNYKESSYPLAVFSWKIENPSTEKIETSLAFTFQNIVGWDTTWPAAPHNSEQCAFVKNKFGQLQKTVEDDQFLSIQMSHKKKPGSMAIAVKKSKGLTLSAIESFNAEGQGKEFWNSFSKKGKLKNQKSYFASQKASALAAHLSLEPGQTVEIVFVLSWDFPQYEFKKENIFFRKYTHFFGRDGQQAVSIAQSGMRDYQDWLKQIKSWQLGYLKQKKLPYFVYGMAFNELYYIADGGTLWTDDDQFGSLECFDYFFYETLDVRYYGSMPLILFWPLLEKNVMKQFAKTVLQEDLTPTRYWRYNWQLDEPIVLEPVEFYSGPKKLRGSVPHDLGALSGVPLVQTNGYIWRNCNYWKDLNAKFVLLIYRDYLYAPKSDKSFLKEVWPAVWEAMLYLKQMDADGDGIPENSGFPDQTYDNWIMKGASAYCAGLWLAALQAAQKIAELLGHASEAKTFKKWFVQGNKSFHQKLWNGNYFDCYEDCSDILSDQLNALWYLKLLKLPSFYSRKQISLTLQTIFQNNVLGFGNGFRGAVNGRKADGSACGHEQGDDVWVGTSMSLADLMWKSEMKEESLQVLNGLFHTIYLEKGLFFRTPEGWNESGDFVGSMYMRAGAIWSILL